MTPLESSLAWFGRRIAAGHTSPIVSDPKCLLPPIPAVTTGPQGRTATLVHPQLVQFSAHHPLFENWTLPFAGQTYTIIKSAWEHYMAPSQGGQNGPDIGLAMLDRPVAGVEPLPTLLNPGTSLTRLPAVCYVHRANRLQLLEVTNFNVQFTTYVQRAITFGLPANPAWRIGTGLVSGDSGSPWITHVAGDMALLCTAQAPRAGTGIHSYYDWIYATVKTRFGLDFKYRTRSLKLGDANDDNVVDFADFIRLSNNFGRKTERGAADGDFDLDGDVDMADFTQLANNIER
jgi:hypothetical protein